MAIEEREVFAVMAVRLIVGENILEHPVVYEFDQTRITIGRSAGSDVVFSHAAVSDHHATIRAVGTKYALVDENSVNGTICAETTLVPSREKPLKNGDVFYIAGVPVAFHSGVAIVQSTCAERTRENARRLVEEFFIVDAISGASNDEPLPLLAETKTTAGRVMIREPKKIEIAAETVAVAEEKRESVPPVATPKKVRKTAENRGDSFIFLFAAAVVAASATALAVLLNS